MFHYQTVEELRQAAQEEGVTLPLGGDLSPLGQELEVQGVKLPNRVAIQPMEGCDGTADGKPGELTLRRYDKFARSGAGLLWEEATAVWEEARANPRQLWIKEENVGAFQAMNQRIRELSQKENGFAPVIIMQATHSGRYSKPQGVPAPLIAIRLKIVHRIAGSANSRYSRFMPIRPLKRIRNIEKKSCTRLAGSCSGGKSA